MKLKIYCFKFGIMTYFDKYCRLTHSKPIPIHFSHALFYIKDWKAEYPNFQIPLQLGVAMWHSLASKRHMESPRKGLPFLPTKPKFDKDKNVVFPPGLWMQQLEVQPLSSETESHMLMLAKQRKDRKSLVSWWHLWIAALSLDHLHLDFFYVRKVDLLHVRGMRLYDTDKCNPNWYIQ